MRKETGKALQAILMTDESIDAEDQTAALSLLRGQSRNQKGVLPLLLNQSEAGRLLGISRVTIYRMIKDGEIHPVIVHGSTKINRKEIEIIAAGAGR